jgi:hypothetical protein
MPHPFILISTILALISPLIYARAILKVTDRTGSVLYEWEDSSSQVVDKNAVKLLNNVLSDQSARAGFVPGYEVMGIANEWIQKSADPFEYLDRIEAAAHSIYG